MQKNLEMHKLKEVTSFKSAKSLREILEEDLAYSKDNGIKLSELIKLLGVKSFGVLLIFLSLPSALPIPAPGYSTPFGIAIALIGIQLFIGRHALKLPKKIESIHFSPRICKNILDTTITFLKRTELLVKPRTYDINEKYFKPFLPIILICLSLLMILPIPLTNTLPAMAVFLFGISISENDDLMIILSFLLSLIILVLYAIIVIGIMFYGPDLLQKISQIFGN